MGYSCGMSDEIKVLNDEEIRELAKSVLQGKPTEKCPISFSYVQAAMHFSRWVENLERERFPFRLQASLGRIPNQ
jgi:hypothetical protein